MKFMNPGDYHWSCISLPWPAAPGFPQRPPHVQGHRSSAGGFRKGEVMCWLWANPYSDTSSPGSVSLGGVGLRMAFVLQRCFFKLNDSVCHLFEAWWPRAGTLEWFEACAFESICLQVLESKAYLGKCTSPSPYIYIRQRIYFWVCKNLFLKFVR